MTDDDQHSVIEMRGYEAIFELIARVVEDSPNQHVAAAQCLNAAMAVALSVSGPKALDAALSSARNAIPLQMSKSRGRLA